VLLWNEIARVCPEGTLFHGVRDFARERGDSRTAGVEKLDRCAKRGEFANASIVGVLWEVSRNHLPASHPRHWANAIEENYMSEQTTAVSYLATVLWSWLSEGSRLKTNGDASIAGLSAPL